MSYTPYCPHSYSTLPDSPAEKETIDWVGVDKLVAEFDISESDAIDYIEGMGYGPAFEELEGERLEAEAQDSQDEADASLLELEWRLAA